MLGQYAASKAANTDSRVFVYEVSGLSQNEVTAVSQSPIRSSHSQFMQVPFHRMNEEMRRITMLGGEIVSIRSLSESASELASESASESAAAPSEAAPKTADSNQSVQS